MAILWVGGEDIDFRANGIGLRVDTAAGRHDSDYARCALNLQFDSGFTTSPAFPGGAVTTVWLSFEIWPQNIGTSKISIGLGNTADCGTGKGLYLCSSAASQTRLSIAKRDGTTNSILDTEAGDSFTNQTLTKIDIAVTSFADTVNGNCKVYANGGADPVIDFTGDMTVSGLTSLNCVILARNTSQLIDISEVVVADEDTRTFRMVTLAPNDSGDLNEWDNDYTSIDEAALSDADLIYTDEAEEDFECTLSDLPAGSFSVRTVKESVRACKTAYASIGGLAIGVKSTTVNEGDTQTLTTGWQTFERFMATNPVTTGNWSTSQVNALQMNLRSKA